MKEFLPISREEAIKKIAEYFNTCCLENIGIVFEKQKDATAFLDEVKKLLNKEDSEVWNKREVYNKKHKVRLLTDSGRPVEKTLEGYMCSKLFIEKKCFEKYFKNISEIGCVLVQNVLRDVENYLIEDENN